MYSKLGILGAGPQVEARTREELDVNRMNGTERIFADLLEKERLAGAILRWDFQPEKLRLADKTWYTPDFRVVDNQHRIVWYEVKGFVRDDAIVKLKVANECHPYVFIMVFWHGVKKGFEFIKIGRKDNGGHDQNNKSVEEQNQRRRDIPLRLPWGSSPNDLPQQAQKRGQAPGF
jgi:hypothetical protein